MRTLSTRVTNLTQEVRPVPKTGRTGSNPVARTVGGSQFVTRVVRLFKTQPATSDSVAVSCLDVFNALGMSGSVAAFRVQAVKAWNMTPAGSTTNFLSLTGLAKLYTSGTTVVTVNDVGTASHLPGVYLNVPNTLTQLNTGTADNLLQVSVDPTGSPGGRAAQTLVFDVYVLARY